MSPGWAQQFCPFMVNKLPRLAGIIRIYHQPNFPRWTNQRYKTVLDLRAQNFLCMESENISIKPYVKNRYHTRFPIIYLSHQRHLSQRQPWKTKAFSVNNQQKWKQLQMHNSLETPTIISTWKTGQSSGSRCPGTVVPGHQQTKPWLHTETETLLSLARWISNWFGKMDK